MQNIIKFILKFGVALMIASAQHVTVLAASAKSPGVAGAGAGGDSSSPVVTLTPVSTPGSTTGLPPGVITSTQLAATSNPIPPAGKSFAGPSVTVTGTTGAGFPVKLDGAVAGSQVAVLNAEGEWEILDVVVGANGTIVLPGDGVYVVVKNASSD